MQVTQPMIDAAVAAARQAIENYSEFDSSMIPDSALIPVVTAALNAAASAASTTEGH